MSSIKSKWNIDGRNARKIGHSNFLIINRSFSIFSIASASRRPLACNEGITFNHILYILGFKEAGDINIKAKKRPLGITRIKRRKNSSKEEPITKLSLQKSLLNHKCGWFFRIRLDAWAEGGSIQPNKRFQFKG